MQKKHLIIAVIFVAAFALLFIYPQIKDSGASRELLTAVGVDEDITFYSMARTDWNNSAAYKSGYELIAMDVDASEWVTPEGWVCEPATISGIAEEYGVVFKDMSSVDELDIYDLTAEYSQWYFAETRGGTEEYPEHVFHIAVYDEGTLIVYRGSNLGEDWVDIILAE